MRAILILARPGDTRSHIAAIIVMMLQDGLEQADSPDYEEYRSEQHAEHDPAHGARYAADEQADHGKCSSAGIQDDDRLALAKTRIQQAVMDVALVGLIETLPLAGATYEGGCGIEPVPDKI